jgi:hypothetical protein
MAKHTVWENIRSTDRDFESEGVEMSEPHTHETPNASLPPLGDGPRRKILITVEVPANWESRMDMQWVLEREIHADRWSWNFPGAVNAAARELLAALDGVCGEKPVWKVEMEALRTALKSAGAKE